MVSPESVKVPVPGIVMEFPVTDGAVSCSPPKMPSRLRRRMSEPKTSFPSSVEEIESKLRGAYLRRQKYYEHLSSKARPKPRSPTHSFSEEDRGQRLEAKLQAAEMKRLNLLAKSRMRLAKLDELRQAARNGLRMRYLKEKAELGSKVELRVQQAEANRTLMLKAYIQRRASLKERTSQSLLQRMARENRYKERVHAAIFQKRAAAEKKRLGLLEAEKRKARARILQVQKVARSISHQREIERQEMQHKLEDKLQRAKRQRAEYLMQRGRSHNSIQANWNKVHKQGDVLARKLARCWRQFSELKKTTFNLAKAYKSLNINQTSVKSMPFEQLALLIESGSALQTTKILLDRLEIRYKLSRTFVPIPGSSTWDDIDHLLKRVASPRKRPTPRRTPGNRESRRSSAVQAARGPAKLSRYQIRIVLCAYMILGHPASVFSGSGDREVDLARSAEKFVRELELLVTIILNGPQMCPIKGSDGESRKRQSLRSQLLEFDLAWCAYLNSFVQWKVKDAESLEEDLVRAACQLEASMIQTCKMTPEGESSALTHDMKAIQKQVSEDQRLLKQKVRHLSGDAGIARMENALSDTRSKYFQSLDGSPVGSPITSVVVPRAGSAPVTAASPGTSSATSSSMKDTTRQSSVVRKLFREDVSDTALGSSSHSHSAGERLVFENEFIVNESVHGDSIWLGGNNNFNDIEEKVKETMKKAFWDGIMESVEKDASNYSRVYDLMREVRDEICQITPDSWKQEVFEAIDMDILSQVLKSGNLDMPYLGKVLEFALVTLQKLSAPGNEAELKASHGKFLDNLSETCQSADVSKKSQYLVLVRGLCFVLEQIQELKQDISKARIRLLEPLLKGPAGLDYLRKAFTRRFGSPDDSVTSLPLTKQWLLQVKGCKDQEWVEHNTSFIELVRRSEDVSTKFLPSTALMTGGASSVGSGKSVSPTTSTPGTVVECTECKGEKVDLLVRLGLLKLAFEITGLTEGGLPETLKLNIFRLRAVQARIQKIIVIATSVLILRQTLASEKMFSSNGDNTDSMVSSSVNKLSELLDSVEDAGISHITQLLSDVVADTDSSIDASKLQSIKGVMARMLSKSLQAGDPIFNRLSRAIYLAVRGVVLGGTGMPGKEMAENALRPVGAVGLINEVVEAASVLLVAARVSVNVHGPWYAKLVEVV